MDAAARVGELEAEVARLRGELHAANPYAGYEALFDAHFHTRFRVPNTWPASTFKPGTPWGDRVAMAMQDAEFLYAEHLLATLDQEGVAGAVVEFGVFTGSNLENLARSLEKLGSGRELWGFDSFEGLPAPDAVKDGGVWHEGQYAADHETVRAFLRADERPWMRLVKGWFADAFAAEPARAMGDVAYARLDGDLYQSALDCLDFLAPRLVDGAVLVFDDWAFSWEMGEPLAFREWAARHPEFRFEFLEMNLWAHLYCRVRKTG